MAASVHHHRSSDLAGIAAGISGWRLWPSRLRFARPDSSSAAARSCLARPCVMRFWPAWAAASSRSLRFRKRRRLTISAILIATGLYPRCTLHGLCGFVRSSCGKHQWKPRSRLRRLLPRTCPLLRLRLFSAACVQAWQTQVRHRRLQRPHAISVLPLRRAPA